MPQGQKKINSPEWIARQEDTKAYRELRRCDLERDEKGKSFWLSRLSTENAQRCATRILKRPEYAEALDPLLAVDALRAGFWLKLMHKVIALGIFEVQSYWNHIIATFKQIADGRTLTELDVLLLEGKCPGRSEKDAEEIAALVDGGKLFPGADQQWRAGLLDRLKRMPVLVIPSLNTFFDDCRAMEEVVPCMYHIADKKPKTSCDHILRRMYTKSTGFETARELLWRFLLLQSTDLARAPTRPASRLLAKQRPGPADEERLHVFATLARTLGFGSEYITQLTAVPAEMVIAKHALMRARKPSAYAVDRSHVEYIQEAMSKVCRGITQLPRPAHCGQPFSSMPHKSRHVAGFPDLLSFERDREHLSGHTSMPSLLEALHGTASIRVQSLCQAFFGAAVDMTGPGDQTERSCEETRPGGPAESGNPGVEGPGWPGEAGEAGEDPSSFSPDCVFFVTLVDDQWQTLEHVQPATRENLEHMATRLCSLGWSLRALSTEGRTGAITPEDCYACTIGAGSNTVLLVDGNYDSSAIHQHLDYLRAPS
ncbi:hypothetical protein V2A60_002359 [Cordyceps javanica]